MPGCFSCFSSGPTADADPAPTAVKAVEAQVNTSAPAKRAAQVQHVNAELAKPVNVTTPVTTEAVQAPSTDDTAVSDQDAPAVEGSTAAPTAPAPPAAPACPLMPYLGAPMPVNEGERMKNLRSLNVLDSEPDKRFDDITRLLCTIFKVPIAVVSLVDTERQWFKSIMGLDASQTDRQSSFCAWTLLPAHPEVLVVEDATKDARFKGNILVTQPPSIRFYAGAPLVSSIGHRLGSLCIIDRKPRKLDAESCNVLCNFAEIVVRQLEKTSPVMHAQSAMNQHAQRLIRALGTVSEGLMMCQLSASGWKVMYVNDIWSDVTGIASEDAVDKELTDLFNVNSKEQMELSAKLQTDFQVTATTKVTVANSRGGTQRLVINFRPAHLDPLDDNMPLIGIPSNVPWDQKQEQEHPYYFAIVRTAEDVLSSDIQPLCEVEGGDVFPEVVLGPLLGKGSFGKVYRGVWKGLPVAVKLIQTDAVAPNGNDKPGAKLEAAVSMSLSHPNIIQTYKTASRQCSVPNPLAGQAPNMQQGANGFPAHSMSPTGVWRSKQAPEAQMAEVWILLEFCDGGTLVDAVEKGIFRGKDGMHAGPPVKDYVLKTALEIASALSYCHSLDVLHGDLTGNNVMLLSDSKDPRGFIAKVTDFGLSRVLQDTVIKTETFGTATHMPPELLTKGLCSKAVDVYGFGVLLWEMWNGQRAWAGMHQLQVIFNITVQNKKLEFDDTADPRYVALAHKCMDSKPEKRPDFAHIVETLTQLMAQ